MFHGDEFEKAAMLLDNEENDEEVEEDMTEKELKEEEKQILRVKALIEKLKPGGILSEENKKVYDPKKKTEKAKPLNKRGKHLANLTRMKRLKTKKVGKDLK